MRKLHASEITDAVAIMCREACCDLGNEITGVYKKAIETEKSPAGREILRQLVDNAEIAVSEGIPACQDTGMTVVFVELGNEVMIEGELLTEAINRGVKRGYEEGYLRKSVVNHPFERKNSGDNTPAVVYVEPVMGTGVKISVMPKGFGSENMSSLAMLKPSDGRKGAVDFIIKTIDRAGPNACPPLFVGVGIGGTADKAMVMAKKSLLRKPGTRSRVEFDRTLEEELIERANQLGIGPAGLGGLTTVFDIFVETYPTHIAGLPVAVNICCHSLRHREVVL